MSLFYSWVIPGICEVGTYIVFVDYVVEVAQVLKSILEYIG